MLDSGERHFYSGFAIEIICLSEFKIALKINQFKVDNLNLILYNSCKGG